MMRQLCQWRPTLLELVQETTVGAVKVEDGGLDEVGFTTHRRRQVVFTNNQPATIRFGTEHILRRIQNTLILVLCWQRALAHCTLEFASLLKHLQLFPNRFPVGFHTICIPKQSTTDALAPPLQFVAAFFACLVGLVGSRHIYKCD